MKKFISLLAGISILLITTGASAGKPQRFTRRFDPIVMGANRLTPFIGMKISHLRLYSIIIKNGKNEIKPVPFQIDERNKSGNWIFNFDKHGKPIPLKRTILAPQDKLVFMAKDAGIKMNGHKSGLNTDKIIEIELTNPINNTHAYAYLAYFRGNPPQLSPVHYVRYNPAKNRVYATLYTLGFSKKVPISYDYFAVPKSAGGEGINLFDRFEVRLNISTFWNTIHINRTENDFKSRLVAYTQGPVRVIRRVKNSMDIALGIQSPSIIADSIFYYDYFQFPSTVNMPVDLRHLYVINKAKLVSTTDFNRNAIGMYFYNSNNPKGLKITGKMSPAQEHLNRSPYVWSVVAGPQGAWMNRVVMGKNVPFTKNLYFVDDEKKLNPPENEPGQIASTGYNFGNLLKTKKGVYTFISYIYIPIGYKPGDEVPWLNILDHPVQTTAYYNNEQIKPLKLQLKAH